MTIADIAHRLGLAESSTRYYRDRFSAFVPVVGEGRSRRYPPEALQVLATIAELSRAGTPAEAITERLRAEYPVNASAAPQPTAAAAAATQQQTAAADRNTPPVVDDLETPPMTDKPTFADPPAPVPAEPPPRPLGLLARVLVYELVAVVTWGVLAAGGAARFDPLGLPLLAVVVGVFAWLTGREWKVRRK